MLFISVVVIELAKLQTSLSRSSKVLNNLFVKSLLNFAHIFSTGLSSGEYGSKK
jgi:hypothetical protein